MAGGSGGQVSPVVATILIVVVLVLAVAGGFWYMNKPKTDTLAEEVHRTRGTSAPTAAPQGPMGGAAPPRAGSRDYENPNPLPAARPDGAVIPPAGR